MSAEAGEARGAVDVATLPLARPAAVMAVGTALSRLTGLGRVVAAAFALGVAESRLADAYNIANTLPLVLYELVLGGILTSIFIPVLVGELRTRAPEEARRSVSALVTTAMAGLLAMTALILVLAPFLIDLFTDRVAGQARADQHALATFFLRMFAPQIALFGAAAVAAALINAHGRFGPPMFAPIVNNVILIGTFVAFAVLTTGVPTEATVERSLGLKLLLGAGATLAVAAMAAVNWSYVRGLGLRLRAVIDLRHPAVRKVARLSVWTLVYVTVNAIGTGISFWLANGQQGGPTAYVTAFAFFQLPIGVAAVSIMTALMPRLSAHFVDGSPAAFRSALATGLRSMVLLMAPATAAYLVLAEPLTRILLEHGVVRAGSVDLVASTLGLFAVGLIPFAGFLLFSRAFYARQDNRTPALYNVLGVGTTVALDFILFPVMGVRGLALAHSAGFAVGALVLGFLLVRRVGGIGGRATAAELAKSVAAACLAAAAMLGALAAVTPLTAPGDVRALLQLAAAGTAGIAVFLGVARALRARDLDALRRLLPGR